MENQENILQGCKRSDRISQEKLYRQFYPGLFALCKKFFDENHDILTALNNGMMNVYKNIDLYDKTKGELFNWAYTIVRNAALTHLRNKMNTTEHSELTKYIESDVQESPFKKLEWKDIYFYLSKLPASTRAVCTLYYIEGYIIKDIAEQMSLSEGTIKWHLSESRAKLKVIFTKNTIQKSV